MDILYSYKTPKVIHTWSSNANIWKEEAYVQMASALSALRYYGYIHFYGDKTAIREVKKFGIPYTTITEIEKEKFDTTFAVPKMSVYSTFNDDSPYIHLDTDTLLFRKIDFDALKSPFIFSHCDKYMEGYQMDYRSSMNSFLHSTVNAKPEDKFHSQLFNTYLKPYFENYKEFPSSMVHNIDVGSIPNMNVVYVQRGFGKTFAKASKEALKFYWKNKSNIDNQENGSCFIEQFLIHQYLRSYNNLYREQSDELKHTLKKRNPLNQLGTPGLRTNTKNTSFPIKFTYQKPRCNSCGTPGETGDFQLDSKNEFKKLFDMDFGDSLHFTHMVWYEWWQCYIIDHIVRNYGEKYVLSIHEHFNKRKGRRDKSPGERLYEEITGKKIFSK